LVGWPSLVFVIGLLAAIILYLRKVRGALLIAIVGATVLAIIVEAVAQVGGSMNADGSPNDAGWRLNVPALPDQWVQLPDFALLGEFSLLGSWDKIGGVTVVLLVFSLLLADFFDTMGTMVAVGTEAKLLDEDGSPVGTRRILIVDSIAAAAGGAGSVSSNTSYIESTAGVADGARTGLASIVTGIAFLLATFLAPIVDIVPSEAATPVLVVVGFLMMTQVLGVDWTRAEVAVPAFLTIILMPFTYSITAGMGAGFIAYVVIHVATGKAKKIHPLMWVTAVLFVLYFIRGPLQTMFG
ncbi:MAG TPA: NCS2 family permease, partial [Candidatus Ruania gallistercoris]|nr:NCS2 family permease [Candidatus Ruania gallistercoris]